MQERGRGGRRERRKEGKREDEKREMEKEEKGREREEGEGLEATCTIMWGRNLRLRVPSCTLFDLLT